MVEMVLQERQILKYDTRVCLVCVISVCVCVLSVFNVCLVCACVFVLCVFFVRFFCLN